MKKSRFTEEQMVRIVRESDAGGVPATEKKHGISEQTLYVWRKKFGSLDASNVRRLKHLEAESAKLKKLLAERDLELEVMKEINRKNGDHLRTEAAGGVRQATRAVGATSVQADRRGAHDVDVPVEARDEGRAGDRGDA